jgi:RNA polymerase-interacting CarD/CdnL/TRCF family regulator
MVLRVRPDDERLRPLASRERVEAALAELSIRRKGRPPRTLLFFGVVRGANKRRCSSNLIEIARALSGLFRKTGANFTGVDTVYRRALDTLAAEVSAVLLMSHAEAVALIEARLGKR